MHAVKKSLTCRNAGIREDGANPTEAAEHFANLRGQLGRCGLYFGGVAFEGYQCPVKKPANVANLAIPYVDVVTTSIDSGMSTTANMDKLADMKRVLGGHPLAAMGKVTVENIRAFKPYVDCLIVDTEVSPTELDRDEVRKLVRAVAQ